MFILQQNKVSVKYSEENSVLGKSLIRIYSLKWVGWGWALIWVWLGGGGGGRLFEAGCLFTFSAFRMGAYSRWALIRGWALIRINTVSAPPIKRIPLLSITNIVQVLQPLLSGHPLLTRHLGTSQTCPLNRSFTVLFLFCPLFIYASFAWLVCFFRVIPLLMLWLGMVTMLLTSTT